MCGRDGWELHLSVWSLVRSRPSSCQRVLPELCCLPGRLLAIEGYRGEKEGAAGRRGEKEIKNMEFEARKARVSCKDLTCTLSDKVKSWTRWSPFLIRQFSSQREAQG